MASLGSSNLTGEEETAKAFVEESDFGSVDAKPILPSGEYLVPLRFLGGPSSLDCEIPSAMVSPERKKSAKIPGHYSNWYLAGSVDSFSLPAKGNEV